MTICRGRWPASSMWDFSTVVRSLSNAQRCLGPDVGAKNLAPGDDVMIYFFAGPHRNGSHFQFYVAQEALKQIGRPFQVLDPTPFHKHDPIVSRRLLHAAANEDGTFLAKGHWCCKKELDLLRSCPNLRVLVIWRDVVDAMISAYRYYYAKKRRGLPGFRRFYWNDVGRWMLIEQYRYRLAYRGYGAFQSSYEGLVNDFESEAARLLDELGIRADVDLAKLEEAVSKPRLRETYGDRDAVFFSRSDAGVSEGESPDEVCLADFRKVEAMSAARLAAESWIEIARQAPRLLARRMSHRGSAPI